MLFQGLNILMDVDEEVDAETSEEEKGEDYNPYFLTDNLVTIDYLYGDSYIYASKFNKAVLKAYNTDGEKWSWSRLADNFDEFIDKLYYKKSEEEVDTKKISKIVNSILKFVGKK